jgi:hypothetical protein
MNFKELFHKHATPLIAGAVLAASVAIGVMSGSGGSLDPLDPTPGPQPQPAPNVVVSDEAKIILKAPDKAKVGELDELDETESNADTFKWEDRTKTKNFIVIDGGRRAIFTAEAGGEYVFVVAAAKGGKVDVVIHTIKVAGGPADPAADLESKVAEWVALVTSDTKRDDALKLAQSFTSVSVAISPGMTPDAIVEATKKSNRAALGNNLDAWVPFLDGLGDELRALGSAGNLPDMEAHRVIWERIGEALKQCAESM